MNELTHLCKYSHIYFADGAIIQWVLFDYKFGLLFFINFSISKQHLNIDYTMSEQFGFISEYLLSVMLNSLFEGELFILLFSSILLLSISKKTHVYIEMLISQGNFYQLLSHRYMYTVQYW